MPAKAKALPHEGALALVIKSILQSPRGVCPLHNYTLAEACTDVPV